jgi:hypothetical protein
LQINKVFAQPLVAFLKKMANRVSTACNVDRPVMHRIYPFVSSQSMDHIDQVYTPKDAREIPWAQDNLTFSEEALRRIADI